MSFFTENDIWAILESELEVWAESYSEDVQIRRGFQPTQQRTPEGFFAFIFQTNNKRYGWQGSNDEYNSGDSVMEHSERYIINKFLQISTQAITKVDAVTTAGDVAESIAAYLQSQVFVERLLEQEIEILRITEVRHPHFVNDADRYEGDPSFDFVISYTQVTQTEGVAVDNITGNLYNECTVPVPTP